MNKKFSKELQSMQRFQSEIQIINYIEIMKFRANKYENRISKLEDNNDLSIRPTSQRHLKTIKEQEK